MAGTKPNAENLSPSPHNCHKNLNIAHLMIPKHWVSSRKPLTSHAIHTKTNIRISIYRFVIIWFPHRESLDVVFYPNHQGASKMAEAKVKVIKPTTLKLRMLAKDGKWKTKDVETIAQNKAVLDVKANTAAKVGKVTLQLPNDWSQELAGNEKCDATFVLMRIPKNKKGPAPRKAAKKVAKKVAKKKSAKKVKKVVSKDN